MEIAVVAGGSGTKFSVNLFTLSKDIACSNMRSRNTLAKIVCLMKTQASFEIRTYIKGRMYLIISGSHIYNGLYQIHRTSAVFNMSVFRWHKKFQFGFTSYKNGFRPGQPQAVDTNVYIAAVAGLIKRDARLALTNIAHSVGILSGSVL